MDSSSPTGKPASETEKNPRRVLAEGRFIRAVAQKGWEWVERTNSSGGVVIVAVTAQRELVLVEQYRIPMGCRVIELPAGLAGDVSGSEHEAAIEAARRELLEETGYASDDWTFLTEGPSSPGLATEIYALFLADGAQCVTCGGGDGHERIHVHVVPLEGIDAWLESRRRGGVMVDPKVFAGLYFALGRRRD